MIQKGNQLFCEGDRCNKVFLLVSGKVKIYRLANDGKEHIVYIYQNGEMFGYNPLLCNQNHLVTAITLEDCEIYSISAKYFLEAIRQSIPFNIFLSQNLCRDYMALTNHIGTFSNRSALERIALSLLVMQEKYKSSENLNTPEITLSRSDLASFAGTTSETLARIITRLKNERVIKVIGRKIVIINDDALYNLAGYDQKGSNLMQEKTSYFVTSQFANTS